MIEDNVSGEKMEGESALELVIWKLKQKNKESPVIAEMISSLKSVCLKFKKSKVENRLLKEDLKPIILKLQALNKPVFKKMADILELWGNIPYSDVQIQAQELIDYAEETK